MQCKLGAVSQFILINGPILLSGENDINWSEAHFVVKCNDFTN